jgi:hypothetical protein
MSGLNAHSSHWAFVRGSAALAFDELCRSAKKGCAHKKVCSVLRLNNMLNNTNNIYFNEAGCYTF